MRAIREIWGRAAPTYDWFQAIRESFHREILTSYGSAKVFSLESLPLYVMRTAPPQRMRVNSPPLAASPSPSLREGRGLGTRLSPPRTPFQFQEIYHGTYVMKHSHLGMIHKKYIN